MSPFKNLLAISALLVAGTLFWRAPSAAAATCSVSSDTVIDQAFVTDNSCTAIVIAASVSTTWIGTVNLGGGTVTVQAGNTMTMGTSSAMTLGPTDDLVVKSGATITHTDEDPAGIRISARDVFVYGAVSANGKGCQGSASGDGTGPDSVTGICASATSGYGRNLANGAGYGGRGGASVTSVGGASATYGSSTYPDLLGSGGSAGGASAAGGGLVHISASRTLSIDGSVTANAATTSPGGGGSGGSVYVQAHALTGTGTIRANGGNSDWCSYGAGGGGGRIAVYYQTLGTFSLGSILASPGNGDRCRGGANGEKGTTFIVNGLSNTPGTDLRVTSGLDFTSDVGLTRANITIDSGSRIGCGEARSSFELTATGTLTDGGATWSCSAGFESAVVSSTGAMTFTGTSLTFGDTDSFTLSASDFVNSGATITVSKAGSLGSFSIQNSALTLTGFTFYGASNASTTSADGGTLSFPLTTDLSLVNTNIYANVSSTLTTLSIDATSSLNANGKGCPGTTSGAGRGPDPVTGICTVGAAGAGTHTAGGAGYGGAGGKSANGGTPSATYGSASYPFALGSSGSGATAAGGRILLNVSATATVEGLITANAVANGWSGGSGGSVNITAYTIMGGGTITANGSQPGWCSYGGGGGGGRVALRYRRLGTFDSSSVTVTGATGDGCRGGSSGAAGSAYTLLLNQSPDLPTALGPATLVDGSTTGTANPTFTFTLTDPDGSDTVKYRIQIDDASDFSTPIVDYTSGLGSQGARSFRVGQAKGSGTYTVGASGQALTAGDYYWQVKAIDASDAASSYAVARTPLPAFVVDLTNHILSFAHAEESGLESVTATSVRILLNTPHFEDVTVAYAVTAGTADGSGTDYTLAAGTATIPAGESSTSVRLSVVDDTIDEPDETFTITLSSPTNAVIGSNTSTVYTIVDNDTGAVTFSDATLSITEGQSGTYTVVLATAPTTTVQILLTPGSGLALSTSTITFTSETYDTPVTVTVTATNNSTYTGNRSASILHAVSTTANGYASLTLSSVSVTILEDDAPPSGGGAVGFAVPVPPPVLPVPPAPEPARTPTVTGPIPETVLNPTDPNRIAETLGLIRDTARETRLTREIRNDLRTAGIAATDTQARSLAVFIAYGVSPATVRLGEGERRALVRDALETMRTAAISPADLERLARGEIPRARSLAAERSLAPRALATFRSIYGHAPRFSDAKENLAWNTLMYRIRFPRDLSAERRGITEFRRTFNRDPKDPFQWATVRALGYVR